MRRGAQYLTQARYGLERHIRSRATRPALLCAIVLIESIVSIVLIVLIVVLKSRSTVGSPPNFSLTKSSVFKPASGRRSPDMRCPLTPRRHHRLIALCTNKENLMYVETFCHTGILLFVSSSRETFVKEKKKKTAAFFLGGGCRRFNQIKKTNIVLA